MLDLFLNIATGIFLVLFILVMCVLFLSIFVGQQEDYLLRKRREAEYDKDYDRLGYYNDRLGRLERTADKLERILFLDRS